MPTASRKVRKTRRLKRERTLAFRLVDIATNQRDEARMIASAIEQELKKYITKYGEIKVEKVPNRTNSVADQLTGDTIGYVDTKDN